MDAALDAARDTTLPHETLSRLHPAKIELQYHADSCNRVVVLPQVTRKNCQAYMSNRNRFRALKGYTAYLLLWKTFLVLALLDFILVRLIPKGDTVILCPFSSVVGYQKVAHS